MASWGWTPGGGAGANLEDGEEGEAAGLHDTEPGDDGWVDERELLEDEDAGADEDGERGGEERARASATPAGAVHRQQPRVMSGVALTWCVTVTNLSTDTTEADVARHFEGCGAPIMAVTVTSRRPRGTGPTGPRAYVTFDNEADARRAAAFVEGRLLSGRSVAISVSEDSVAVAARLRQRFAAKLVHAARSLLAAPGSGSSEQAAASGGAGTGARAEPRPASGAGTLRQSSGRPFSVCVTGLAPGMREADVRAIFAGLHAPGSSGAAIAHPFFATDAKVPRSGGAASTFAYATFASEAEAREAAAALQAAGAKVRGRKVTLDVVPAPRRFANTNAAGAHAHGAAGSEGTSHHHDDHHDDHFDGYSAGAAGSKSGRAAALLPAPGAPGASADGGGFDGFDSGSADRRGAGAGAGRGLPAGASAAASGTGAGAGMEADGDGKGMYRLRVRGLPDGVSRQELARQLEAGTRGAPAPLDLSDILSPGQCPFAFATYASRAEAEEARAAVVASGGLSIRGKALNVDVMPPARERGDKEKDRGKEGKERGKGREQMSAAAAVAAAGGAPASSGAGGGLLGAAPGTRRPAAPPPAAAPSTHAPLLPMHSPSPGSGSLLPTPGQHSHAHAHSHGHGQGHGQGLLSHSHGHGHGTSQASAFALPASGSGPAPLGAHYTHAAHAAPPAQMLVPAPAAAPAPAPAPVSLLPQAPPGFVYVAAGASGSSAAQGGAPPQQLAQAPAAAVAGPSSGSSSGGLLPMPMPGRPAASSAAVYSSSGAAAAPSAPHAAPASGAGAGTASGGSPAGSVLLTVSSISARVDAVELLEAYRAFGLVYGIEELQQPQGSAEAGASGGFVPGRAVLLMSGEAAMKAMLEGEVRTRSGVATTAASIAKLKPAPASVAAAPVAAAAPAPAVAAPAPAAASSAGAAASGAGDAGSSGRFDPRRRGGAAAPGGAAASGGAGASGGAEAAYDYGGDAAGAGSGSAIADAAFFGGSSSDELPLHPVPQPQPHHAHAHAHVGGFSAGAGSGPVPGLAAGMAPYDPQYDPRRGSSSGGGGGTGGTGGALLAAPAPAAAAAHMPHAVHTTDPAAAALEAAIAAFEATLADLGYYAAAAAARGAPPPPEAVEAASAATAVAFRVLASAALRLADIERCEPRKTSAWQRHAGRLVEPLLAALPMGLPSVHLPSPAADGPDGRSRDLGPLAGPAELLGWLSEAETEADKRPGAAHAALARLARATPPSAGRGADGSSVGVGGKRSRNAAAAGMPPAAHGADHSGAPPLAKRQQYG